MVISIPPQFQAPGFRFVKLGRSGDLLKRPVEYFWDSLTLEEARRQYAEDLVAAGGDKSKSKKLQAGEPSRLTNYAFDDPILLQHLQRGLNYGVVNGTGPNGAGLVTLDADNLPRLAELVDLSKLPPTLEAGRREENGEPIPDRRHFHFISDLEGKHILKDPETGEDLGDLRGTGGYQVVGPGSLHPSGARVEVLEDRPIAEISGAELLRALAPVLEASSTSKLAANREKLEALKPKRRPPTATDDPFEGVAILDVIDTSGFSESGGQLFGAHPVHGSDTDHNLVVNPAKNSWWCGRHQTGGGPALWLAVEAGIIHCDEAKSGAISGSKFIEVLDYAKSKGIIPDDRPKATTTPQVKEPKPTSDELLSFTRDDFGYYDKTMVYHFSPTKAIDAVLGKIPMCATGFSRQDKDIYRFDGEIYKLDADSLISVKLRDTCGDYAQTRQINEVLNGVLAALKRHPVSLVPDPFLMPLQNGVVDLRTGELRSYKPDDYFTFKYCAHYDPSGGDWKRVLWQLCSTLRDPRDVLQAIDIMTSMVLRVPFNSWCLLFGGGSNGKGNFEDMMAAFVGPDRVSGMTLDELKASRFGPGTLLDVDLLIVSEVEGVKGATNAIKKIATGEFLDSDVKFGGRKKGRPHLLTVLDANQAFDYGDDSFGRRRRTIKMDFPYQFGYGPSERPMDPHMKDKITSPGALSGIASIVIARAPYLIESRRIYRYKSISESEAEYEIQRYPKKYFVEHCISSVDYDDYEWRSLIGEGTDRLDMPTVVSEYRDFCMRFNVPISDEDKNVSQELGGYISKVFDVKSVSTSKSEGGKVTRYRYYPGIWLKKSAAAVHADHLLSYSTTTTPTTLLLQRDKIEIDISEYITTATTATTAKWGILSMEEIIGEICKMFLYISSCKNPQEICWEKFVENPVVSVVAVVRGRSVSVCLPEGVVSAVVETPQAVVETQIPSQLIQHISELERKEEITKPADLAEEYHIPEKDVCEMLDRRGWTEGRGGFWTPPSRSR